MCAHQEHMNCLIALSRHKLMPWKLYGRGGGMRGYNLVRNELQKHATVERERSRGQHRRRCEPAP